jgi:glyoxylase-like metal-dependent hydrolase (beta-lactamase superfamily II)
MKIIPLSEGSFTIDQTKEFVPFQPSVGDLQSRSRGSLLVEIQPFLVITEKDVLLLDTGLGFTDGQGILQLHQNLALHGYYPSDVTKVLMSHLHKDHAGGMFMHDSLTNEDKLAFPNSIYYIHRKEIEFALSSQGPSYDTNSFESLLENDQVILLEEEKGLIDGYIEFQITAGHSPFHQVFSIFEKNRIVFFGGDEAPQLQQMKTKFVAKYDADGKKAMELRSAWWELGIKEGWIFLFYHDIKTPSFGDTGQIGLTKTN